MIDWVAKLAVRCFGSVQQSIDSGMVIEDNGVLVLTNNGAQLVEFFILIGKQRGLDTSETQALLIEVQTKAAIRQATRQIDEA